MVLNEILSNIEVFDDLELKQGCYFLYDGDEVVYVGLSHNIDQRLISHMRTKDFNRVKYIPITNYIHANLVESYYIDLLKPKYNKKPGVYGKDVKSRNYYIHQDGWEKVDIIYENYDEYQIPSLDKQIDNINTSGVFMLINKGVPFYIGTSYNISAYLHSTEMRKYRNVTHEVWVIEENDYLTALKIEEILVSHFNPVRTSLSKLKSIKISWGDRYDETTIPYPKGWIKK